MIKSIFTKSFALLFGMSLFYACQEHKMKEIVFPPTDLSSENLIPKPLKIVPTHNAFGLDHTTAIYTSQADKSFEDVGTFLADKIKSKTNLRLAVNKTDAGQVNRMIFINQSDSDELEGPEAYQLYISKDSIILNAKTSEGAFRGVQTLRQLIPETSNDTLTEMPLWPIATGKILDKPNFEYRGSMLDVARHFFSVDDVKKYIDLLAYYKINALHLHLTDDQGWR